MFVKFFAALVALLYLIAAISGQSANVSDVSTTSRTDPPSEWSTKRIIAVVTVVSFAVVVTAAILWHMFLKPSDATNANQTTDVEKPTPAIPGTQSDPNTVSTSSDPKAVDEHEQVKPEMNIATNDSLPNAMVVSEEDFAAAARAQKPVVVKPADPTPLDTVLPILLM